MTPLQWARVKQIFAEALELPEAARDQFISDTSHDDAELAAEVRSLLAADARARTLNVPLPTEDAPSTVPSGSTIGRYQIVRHLASGGMGDVYVANDPTLGRSVALKVLPSRLARDPQWRARFHIEAKAVAALNHPNIVTIHSVEDADGVTFLTMELVDGQPLSRLIASGGLPQERLLPVAIGIADALAAAHARGIIHRDLKPANVIVTPDHRVKVLDFGLAVLPGLERTDEQNAANRMAGTPGYMSPEQSAGQPADERSDIYSLGATLYEMSTRQRPFNGKLSGPLSDVITRALAEDPARRFQTAADMREAIYRIAASKHAVRRRWSIAAMVVILAASAWFAYSRWPPARPAHAFADFEISRITTNGTAMRATITPDGTLIAYVARESGLPAVWIKEGNNVRQIVAHANVTYRALSVSPDGRDVYYTIYPHDSNIASLYRVSTRGGGSTKIAVDVDSAISLSSDARQIAFVRGFTDHTAVVTMNADGTHERVVARRTLPLSYLLSRAVWSPDNTTIAVGVADDRSPGRSGLAAVSVLDGTERTISEQNWHTVRDLLWLPDGTGLLVNGVSPASFAPIGQIWYLSADGRDLRRITNDLSDYGTLGVTRDAHAFVTVQAEGESFVWITDADGTSPLRLSTDLRAGDGFGGLAWTPDGKIVYTSRAGGKPDIWIADADGSHRRRVTNDAFTNSDPAVTPDGRYVFYVSRRDAKRQLIRYDLRDDTQQVVSDSDGAFAPMMGPDNQVYFTTPDPGRFFSGVVWRTTTAAGLPREATPVRFQGLALSPDGRMLVGNHWNEAEHRMRLATLAMTGSSALTELPLGPRLVEWTPDGRLTCATSVTGVGNIWTVPLDGRPPQQLTHFDEGQILAFAWSPDGRKLATARGRMPADVVMVKERKSP